MRIGLFGFPMTGKSTLFRLLTGAEIQAHGGRGEAQVGVSKVPDPRLDKLAAIYNPKKVVPATIEYLARTFGEKSLARFLEGVIQSRSIDRAMSRSFRMTVFDLESRFMAEFS